MAVLDGVGPGCPWFRSRYAARVAMATTPASLRLEQALHADLAGTVDQHARETIRSWAMAYDEIAGDLADALEGLIRASADNSVTRRDLLLNRRLQQALAVIADALDTLLAGSASRAIGDLQLVVTQAGAAQAQVIAAMLPEDARLVDLDAWSRVNPLAIGAIVQRSTEQITSRSRPLSAEAYMAVRRELIRGVAAGSNPRQTARRIVARSERGFTGGLARALTVARTETLDAHRAGAALGQAQHPNVLTGWVWNANLGPRTCRACLAMHGQEFPLDTPGPYGHQNCRCSRSPKTLSWAELGFPGIEEPEDVRPDAETYFQSLSAADQRHILGKRGYAAWVRGDYPIKNWVRRRSNSGWRDSFVPTNPPRLGSKGVGGGRSTSGIAAA